MRSVDVNDPVARTAFYCCILRADDAAKPEPWCNDTLAARFVDEVHRRDLAGALRLKNPAAANLGRHYIVDGLVRQHLAADPGRRVILLGAGFDTRAFRMRGGRWFEIDDPPLLGVRQAIAEYWPRWEPKFWRYDGPYGTQVWRRERRRAA